MTVVNRLVLGGPTSMIAGLAAMQGEDVADDADDDELIVVVCVSAGYFPDDVHGECDECGAGIVWRPDAPQGRRLCVGCATALYPEAEVAVTPKTVSEIRAWLARQRH
jgi:hypothetical protein